MIGEKDYQKVKNFIENHWGECIRLQKEDNDTLIGLPKPYVVPCTDGAFQEIYYWDTYFTNQGLKLSGYGDLVLSNTENMLYLVERYGFMPNGNRTFYLNRSQPPYLSMMVRDVYEIYGDKEWLRKAIEGLKKEYNFWMSKRMTPIGLNRYGQHSEEKDLLGIYEGVNRRLRQNQLEEDKQIRIQSGANFMAECESGWDFTPRFNSRCEDYVPLDLNSNLYIYEMNFSHFYTVLGNDKESREWEEKAINRKKLMNTYLWDSNKEMFTDYDWKNKQKNTLRTAAMFHPLFAGWASKEQVNWLLQKHLPFLEKDFGIFVCEENNSGIEYQWDFPNGWAPLQYIAIRGLVAYGYQEEAKRIATKYIDLVTKVFMDTGYLWEKYNAKEGSIKVSEEYEMPTMLGWTAGTYLYALDLTR